MTPDDLFVDADRDAWGLPAQKANVELLNAVIAGTFTDAPEAEVALTLAERLRSDLMLEGTGKTGQFTNDEARVAIRALSVSCGRLGVPFRLPFRDYAGFSEYWISRGASGGGGYDKRRAMVRAFMDSAIESLDARAADPHIHAVPEVALTALTDPSAIRDALRRMAQTVDTDPRLAVSHAKDLIESTAKLVLTDCGQTYDKNDDLPKLAARAQAALGLTKRAVTSAGPDSDSEALGQLLGALSGLVGGVAQLRNAVGVGHGRESVPNWVQPRHARLASGAATTWCSLVLETLADPDAPWRSRTA